MISIKVLKTLNTFNIMGIKPVVPMLSFERSIAKGVSQNRRQKRKAPGVKRVEGDYVRKGEKLLSQFYLNFHPGLNVSVDNRNTLRALRDGQIIMTCEKINPKLDTYVANKYYSNMSAPVIYKRFYHVIPFPQGQKFKLDELV